MAIRAFIAPWTLVGNEVHNPIVDHVDTLPNMGIVCSMIYPDADENGVPDGATVLVAVQSDQITGAEIEQMMASLDGVTLIPGFG